MLAYDPEQVKPGWVAFFLVMLLILATFLLWRSMNTQLGRIKVPPASSFTREQRGATSQAGADAAATDDDADGPQA